MTELQPSSTFELLVSNQRETPTAYVATPPTTFSQLHEKLKVLTRALPPSEVRSALVAHAAFDRESTNQNLEPPSAQIDVTQDGEFIFYHVTSKPGEFMAALRQDALAAPPPDPKWGSRCYGPRAAFFTSESLALNAQQSQPHQTEVVRIAIAPTPRTEVTLKQGYWEYMLNYAAQNIDQSPILSEQLVLAAEAVQANRQVLETRLLQDCAFYLRSYMIDMYTMLVPTRSKVSFSATVQSQLGEPQFGYRSVTHEKFFQVDNLLEVVRKMLQLDVQSEIQRQNFLHKIESTLTAIKANFETFMPTRQILMDKDAPLVADVQRFALFSLLRGHQNGIRTLIAGTPECRSLLELCDGWYPIAETSTLFREKHGFGTDLGSNTVGLIGHFDERTAENPDGLHRILD